MSNFDDLNGSRKPSEVNKNLFEKKGISLFYDPQNTTKNTSLNKQALNIYSEEDRHSNKIFIHRIPDQKERKNKLGKIDTKY